MIGGKKAFFLVVRTRKSMTDVEEKEEGLWYAGHKGSKKRAGYATCRTMFQKSPDFYH